jgi:hypothetical protein
MEVVVAAADDEVEGERDEEEPGDDVQDDGRNLFFIGFGPIVVLIGCGVGRLFRVLVEHGVGLSISIGQRESSDHKHSAYGLEGIDLATIAS